MTMNTYLLLLLSIRSYFFRIIYVLSMFVAAVTVVNSMFFDFYTSSQRRWLFLNLKGDSQGFTRQKKTRDTIFTLYSAREDDF